MSEQAPPKTHETHAELVACSRHARPDQRVLRTRCKSAAAAALAFAMLLANGATDARADSAAESATAPAAQTAPDPALRELQADLDRLFEKVSADIDARVKARTDAIVEQAMDRQVAALLRKNDQNLALARENSRRTDEGLADVRSPLHGNGVERAGDHEVKIASGSLEVAQHEERLAEGSEDRDERVERGRHRFEEAFVSAPKVALGVRVADVPRTERPRVAIRVVGVDKTGFDYEIRTWGDFAVSDLTADWIAYAQESRSAPPAALP